MEIEKRTIIKNYNKIIKEYSYKSNIPQYIIKHLHRKRIISLNGYEQDKKALNLVKKLIGDSLFVRMLLKLIRKDRRKFVIDTIDIVDPIALQIYKMLSQCKAKGKSFYSPIEIWNIFTYHNPTLQKTDKKTKEAYIKKIKYYKKKILRKYFK